MKKKLLAAILIVCIITSFTLPTYAVSYGESQRISAENYIIDTFGYYYDLYDGDTDRAVEALLASKDSLTLLSINHTSDTVFPASSRLGYEYGERSSDIDFTDLLVHDNDWGAYVYTGTWKWSGVVHDMDDVNPNSVDLKPEDVVAVYSQNADRMRINQIIAYGYDFDGTQTCVYDSAGVIPREEFANRLNEPNIRALTFDESIVYRGRISASLRVNYSAGDSLDKVMLQYEHSWSTQQTNSFGFSVGTDSVGLDVGWDNGISNWSACSEGSKLP